MLFVLSEEHAVVVYFISVRLPLRVTGNCAALYIHVDGSTVNCDCCLLPCCLSRFGGVSGGGESYQVPADSLHFSDVTTCLHYRFYFLLTYFIFDVVHVFMASSC